MLHGSDHFFFFFNDTATTEIYTLSLHDALPISPMTTALRQRPVASSRARVSSMVRNPKTPGSRLPSSRRTPVSGGGDREPAGGSTQGGEGGAEASAPGTGLAGGVVSTGRGPAARGPPGSAEPSHRKSCGEGK